MADPRNRNDTDLRRHFLLVEIIEFFGWLYQADERPVARRFTIGCAALVAIIVGVVLIVAYH